jgi:predicted adenine nucleotide alpha hydrolase (AANH) superfamily ATPase
MTKLELSRRLLLRKAAVAVSSITVFGTITKSAKAQAKSSQQAVGYQNEPNAGHRCGTCFQFQPPCSM